MGDDEEGRPVSRSIDILSVQKSVCNSRQGRREVSLLTESGKRSWRGQLSLKLVREMMRRVGS